MSRLMSCGFESGIVANTGGEGSALSGTALSAYTTDKRTGAYSLRAAPSTSVGVLTMPYTQLSAGQTAYHRFYLKIVTAPSATTAIFTCLATGGRGAGDGIDLRLTTASKLQLWSILGNVQRGADSAALTTGQWYRIEASLDPDGNASARIDGTQFASSASEAGTISSMLVGVATDGGANVTSGEWLFDDIAINNSAGTVQNSWPGAGSIVHLYPSASGDAAAGSGLFSDVDEVPTSTADFIAQTVINTVAYYEAQNGSVPGIGASDTVTLFHVGGICRAATAASCNYLFGYKVASGGTSANSSTTANQSTTWNFMDDTAATRSYVPGITAYTNPDTAVAWTPGQLDVLEIGWGSGNDVTPNPQCAALWALVEYVPSAVTPTVAPPPLMSMRPYAHLIGR
jgi:hypothetical protein